MNSSLFVSSSSSVLLLIRDSYVSGSKRLISLKVCAGFYISSVRFRLFFIKVYIFAQLTLKCQNSFFNKNNRKAHSFFSQTYDF